MNRNVSEIRERLSDVNIVSFSGGKDSTVVLRHVLSALDGQKLYIVTADTLMEIPYYRDYLDGVNGRIRRHIERMPNVELVTVRPSYRDSFWTSVLGKGYPAAHMGFRWCTGKLKIDPISKFTRGVAKGGSYTVFIGVRAAESDLRAKIYGRKDYKPHHFAPILDWTSHDVWEYLLSEPCPWGGDHSDLVEVYRYSSDECVYGEKQGVCVGNARYGCWACPLQKSSQLDMVGFHTGDAERYAALKRYKKMLTSLANRSACRSRIRRDGSPGTGPFLVPVRRRLYADLKKLESRTGWNLIENEEEECIFAHWKADENVHDTADPTQPLLWGMMAAT